MGENTSKVFSGEAQAEAVHKMYAESPKFYASEIRKRLNPDRQYMVADVGAFRGELAGQLKQELSDFDLKVFAIDIDDKSLANNPEDRKFIANGELLPLKDKSVDIAMARYVLQWNNAERQKEILKEISRIVSKFAIIEHPGADCKDSDLWRSRLDDLFSGKELAKLKRGEHFFTSRDEMEQWMSEAGIKFERAKDFVIEDMAIMYAERFNLTPEELAKTYEILGDKNYLPITDWIIYPKN